MSELTEAEKYSVIYSPEAISNFREIYSYLSFTLQVPSTAEALVNRIRAEIRSLDFMPSRYRIVDWEPWKSMKMHQVSVGNFVIYYTINDEKQIVTVIRIVYGGRDVKSILGEKQ